MQRCVCPKSQADVFRIPRGANDAKKKSLAFLRARSSDKVADFRFHDLRHTVASWMRMNGADIQTDALIL
jgi:integrase